MEQLDNLYIRGDEQFKLTNGIFACVESKILVDIQRGRYPFTQKALYYASKKIDIILKSILNQQSPEFFYVNNILVRALFEHYLVAYFISVKCENESSDKCAREFYSEYLLSEHIKRVSYDISVDDIINKVPKRDVFEEFKKLQPDYSNMKISDRDEVHRKGNQFVDIKAIIKYLLHHDRQHTAMKSFHETLPILLKVYNMVSSYVHGGVAAEIETFEYFDKQAKEKRIKTFVHYCKVISYGIKQRLMTMLIPISPDFSNFMKPIEFYIKGRYEV